MQFRNLTFVGTTALALMLVVPSGFAEDSKTPAAAPAPALTPAPAVTPPVEAPADPSAADSEGGDGGDVSVGEIPTVETEELTADIQKRPWMLIF